MWVMVLEAAGTKKGGSKCSRPVQYVQQCVFTQMPFQCNVLLTATIAIAKLREESTAIAAL
jgi:hypothetical protein